MAIAFDAVTNGGLTPASWSHTCATAGNRLLLVAVDGTNNPTGFTYAGTALTQLGAVTIGNGATGRVLDLWYLINPATGTNTVSVTGGTSFIGISMSYTGVSQYVFPDASVGQYTGGGGSSMTQAGTVTQVAADCWLVGFTDQDGTNATAGASTTRRSASVTYAFEAFDSNGTRTPGSQSLNFANVANVFWSFIVVSIRPAIPSMLAVF